MGLDRLPNQVAKERRDLRVLQAVMEFGPIGIGRIADETDVQEYKVRYSLRMLEDDGLVEPTDDGAVPVADLPERIEEMNEGIDHLIERLESLKGIFPEDVEE